MSRGITIGQYLPGHSLVHRLDPRAKLLSLVVFITGIFTVPDLGGLLIFLALVVLWLFISGVSFGRMLRGLRPILFIIILTLFIHVFFTEGGVVFWRAEILNLGDYTAEVTIEADGVNLGAFTALRLITLIFYTMLVTLTTTPLALTGAMEFFLRPFKYLRLPVSEITMIIMIALRFIPTLMEESTRIVKAQMARGADFGEGNLLRRAKALVPVMVPLFVSAFRRAEDLATAMEARCYRVGARRTSLQQSRVEAKDYLSVAVSFLLVVGVVLWEMQKGGWLGPLI